MPFNSRQVREYAGGSSSIGGILRKGGSNTTSSSSMISASNSTNTAAYCGEPKQIDLLVFGYACKIFRDDDKAREIDQGKHLIPWMGDSSLKIDRYDVRGALYDLSPYEAPPGGYGNRLDYLTAEEQRAEQLCEEERYLFLYKNEEQHILHQEEELKRFKQESSGYNQIAYEYDAVNNNGGGSGGVQHGPSRENCTDSPTCEEADQLFTLPMNFVVPPTIQLPETMKQHAIIEKTARFIASQGVQMEILLKAKQSNNLQFEFLTQNSLLNNYYKFVLNAIKDGTYPAEQTTPKDNEVLTKEQEIDNMEDIFPTKPIITVPIIKYKPSANCAYTQLISKIKGLPIPTAIDENSTNAMSPTTSTTTTTATTAIEENFTPVLLQYNGNTFVTAAAEDSNSNSQDTASKSATNSPPKVELLKNSSALLLAQNYSSDSDSEVEEKKPPTPPEPKLTCPIPTDNLKNIIDKTATYVIKNGRQFEETLRTKSEERFTFLLPDNEFYPYYMYKITGDPDAASIEQKTRRAAAVAAALISKKKLNIEKSTGPVSFSIKSKEDQPISGLQPALPQETSDDDEDNTKKQQNNNSSSSTDNTQQRTVPEHVKKAIQLVESQLMARNAQLAAVVGATAAVLPCNLPNRSRFDIDYSGQLAPKPITAHTSAEMERNAIFEQQQQNRHKELKRAEEKVKDKLAQIAREKLGGLITKEKQLQLERKRKAMAFLNQIKGSSENESTPDKRPANDDGDVSDNSETSVHSIPITSYGPDDKSDDEVVVPPPLAVIPPSMPTTSTAKAETAKTTFQRNNRDNINISAAVTVSDDDEVELIGETKLSDYILTHRHNKSQLKRQRHHRSRSRTHAETPQKYAKHFSRKSYSSVSTDDDDDGDEMQVVHVTTTKSHSHKSSKTKKSSSSSASKGRNKKSKSKKQPHPSRSRSQSSSRHLRSPAHSTYRTSQSRYSREESITRVNQVNHSRSASEESVISRSSSKRHHHKHSKRSKHSHTPTRKEKSRRKQRVY